MRGNGKAKKVSKDTAKCTGRERQREQRKENGTEM